MSSIITRTLAEVDVANLDLPVIDFGKRSASYKQEEHYSIGKKLARACHNVGFVYIINHGVSSDLLEEAFDWSKKLFNLKQDEKIQGPHPPGSTVHRGYSYLGLEKVSQVISHDKDVGEKLREVKDCKESYEIS